MDRDTLLRLLREQLGEDLDDDCHDLDIQGARGALFRVTLRPYGYTMVAKGTVAAFVPALRYECKVYERLWELQGKCVPVCLGNIDMIHPYYYDLDVDIIHMMFLAWAGKPWTDIEAGEAGPTPGKEVIRTLDAIHRARVVHGDVRPPNVLWNAETKRAMLVDFERSTMAVDRPALSPIAPNLKRKRGESGGTGGGKGTHEYPRANLKAAWVRGFEVCDPFPTERMLAMGMIK